jgi:folate-binding protein YgfZ
VILEMPRDRLDRVEEELVRYRVGAPVRFARPEVAVLGVLGPEAPERLRGLGLEPPGETPESHVTGTLAGAEVRVIRAGDLPATGLVLQVPDESRAAVWEALLGAGARPLGRAALDVLRIEDGRPWYGPDIRHEHLLHETGLLKELHSFSKGCYVGQEVVARLEGRGGHVSRQLRGLRLEAPAAPGDPIEHEGAPAGSVTTAGVSPTLGPVAMGYVHRKGFEPGTPVSVAGGPARVAALPLVAA